MKTTKTDTRKFWRQ